MTTNHRVRKIQILDDGLKLSLVVLRDHATEDRGDLVGLADGPVGIQQSLPESIQCGPAVKNEVVGGSTGYQGRSPWLVRMPFSTRGLGDHPKCVILVLQVLRRLLLF